MIDRNIYNEMINIMSDIASHYSEEDFEKDIKQIVEIRDQFDVKLIVGGHFSAGKSSLLNALIKRPGFLKEAQEPKTAIAAEINYSENESAVAYRNDGEQETLCQDKDYLSSQYHHLEYRLFSPELKEISDYTIVDTPGFDVGLEAHAKALANYIGRGSAYIVVVDQEKGGIDQATLEFVREISNYSDQIVVLINKCDKIIDEDVKKVVGAAESTLRANGFNYKVYSVSKQDEDISDRCISIISGLNAQSTFNKVLLKQIKLELDCMENVLFSLEKRIYLDTFDLDKEITMYGLMEKRVLQAFEVKKRDAYNELDNTVQGVCGEIRRALIARADDVVGALLNNNQSAVDAIIIETIRPILVSSMRDISHNQVEEFVNSLDFTGVVSDIEDIDLTAITVNLADKIKTLIEQHSGRFKRVADNKSLLQSGTVYRAVAGIGAMATNIIHPWLEIVVILLPDISDLLRGLFGESREEKAKDEYISKVIPQLMNKLYPKVKGSIEVTINLVLEEYKKMLQAKLESIRNNLGAAQTKKRQKTEDFETYKKTIVDDLTDIRKIICELR